MGQAAKKDDHAWKGSWDRPMKVDEDSLDPLTVARMTDHNVRGTEGRIPPAAKAASESKTSVDITDELSDEQGKLKPEEAERISSRDLPDST